MSHHGGISRAGDRPPECQPGSYICTPRMAPGPGGVAFRHAMSCPIHPGERIDLRQYAKGRNGPWPPKGRTA